MARQCKALHRSARGVTTDPGSIPVCVAAGCNWDTHEAVHNWPSVVLVRGGFGYRDVLVPLCSRDSCGGPGAGTLTWSQVGRCFLRHIGASGIGASGFRVKRAVCQEAVWPGGVVFHRMHGSRP